MTKTATATTDAAVLLRSHVTCAVDLTDADCMLLNAALHVEGRHVPRCSTCGDNAHYGHVCPHRYTEPHAS
jgi:hypothetical protein